MRGYKHKRTGHSRINWRERLSTSKRDGNPDRLKSLYRVEELLLDPGIDYTDRAENKEAFKISQKN